VAEQSGAGAPHSTTLRVIEGALELARGILEGGAPAPLSTSPLRTPGPVKQKRRDKLPCRAAT